MTDIQFTKEEKRKQQYYTRLAIIKYVKCGTPGREIAQKLGISTGYVSRIKKDFEENGYEALKQYNRGMPWGNETTEMWEKELIFQNDID